MSRSRTAAWAVPVGIALFTAAVFLPVLRAGFVDWDDPINFLENPYYRGLGWRQLRWMLTATVMGHWIPVTWLTLGADFAVWGMNPFGYHLTNLLLHTASAVLFYLVSRRLLGLAMPAAAPGVLILGAAAAALVFAVHPLRVESVAWITERRDVLSGLFFLAAILAYLRGVETGDRIEPRWRTYSLLLFAGGLLSKASVMTLPAVLVLLDVYPLRRGAFTWRRLIVEKAGYWALALAGAVGALVALKLSGLRITPYVAYGPAARLAMVAYSFWFYPSTWVWPIGLSPMYELPARLDPLSPRFLLPVIGLVAVTTLLALLRKRWPGGLAAWVYSAVMLLPISGVVHAGFQLAHDRYSYLSGLGFALLVGGAITWILRATADRLVSRPVAAGALAATALVVVALGIGSWQQIHVWRDSETLWRWGLEVDPGCAICHHNLGVILGRRGDRAEAQALLERAIALRPDRSEFQGNYGLLLIQMGRRPEGMAMLRYRLDDNPRDVNTRVNLGITLIEDGRLGEAIVEIEQALRIKPDSVTALNSLGRALLADGRVEPARAAFERALTINAADPVAHLGLARAHLARGDRAAAREQIPILDRLDPQLARMLEQEIR
jgi:Flp pilus assembly protein TadD